MTNSERQNARAELMGVYNKYIEEMAKDALDKKQINQSLLEASNKIMYQIRDWDILISMNKQKENTEEINKTI